MDPLRHARVLLIVAVLGGVGSGAAGAAEDAPGAPLAVCVDGAAAPDGLDPAAVRTALLIEARKTGRTIVPCEEGDRPSEDVVAVLLRDAPAAEAVIT